MTEVPTNPAGPAGTDGPAGSATPDPHEVDRAVRDIGEVPAVEVITTVALHLMSAAEVKCGLGDEGDEAVQEWNARSYPTDAPDMIPEGRSEPSPLPDRIACRRARCRRR